MQEGFLIGDAESTAAVARVVHDAVLHDPVVRLKIWARDGVIVYSDESRLIGSRYTLSDDDLEVLWKNGNRIFNGSRMTKAPSGSFTVRLVTGDTAGTDSFRARAANAATGEVCGGRASI